MSITEIYYFSGTGNSFFVAKELTKRLDNAKLIPIVSLLKNDHITINAETVGFIFPIHGLTLPLVLKSFLRKIILKDVEYIFAVATRGGTKCLAFDKMNKQFMKRDRKKLDSSFIITMPSNDPKFEVYDVPADEEISASKKNVQNITNTIAKIIENKEQHFDTDTDYVDFPYNKFLNFLLEKLVLFGMFVIDVTNVNKYFYTDSNCIGCGVCEKVCLSNKIEMRNKKPFWRNDISCYFCYACLNFCPEQSIQIKDKIYMKSYTHKNGRYSHPFATVKDIEKQKHKHDDNK